MEETYDVKKAIIYLVVLILVIGLFYGITVLVINNKDKEESQASEPYTSIQYEEIIVSNILKQTADDYYVLVTTKNDEKYKQYISDYTTYTTKKDALPTYRVDLDNSFNKSYLQAESDFTGDPLIFKESTLLRITNHQISEIYGKDEIQSAISYLVNGI